jgi:hypothetical protein
MGMAAAAPLTQAKARYARLSLTFFIFCVVCWPLPFHYHEQLNQQTFCVVQFEKCFSMAVYELPELLYIYFEF